MKNREQRALEMKNRHKAFKVLVGHNRLVNPIKYTKSSLTIDKFSLVAISKYIIFVFWERDSDDVKQPLYVGRSSHGIFRPLIKDEPIISQARELCSEVEIFACEDYKSSLIIEREFVKFLKPRLNTEIK